SYVDLTTGELCATTLSDVESVLNEASSLQTKEMVLTDDQISETLKENLKTRLGIIFSKQESYESNAQFKFLTNELDSAVEKGVTRKLLQYLAVTQKRSLDHLQQAESYQVDHFLKLDHYSKANLELSQLIRSGKKHGTLLWLLDETKTAMGGRLLKQWLDRPLIQKKAILKRQDQVASLLDAFFEREDLKNALTKVYDLERLAGRVAFGNVNGRDLLQLKASLEQVPVLRAILSGINQGEWSKLLEQMEPMDDLVDLIEKSIAEDAPLLITEGKVIKDGFNDQLDKYREAMRNGKKWLAELEAKERKKTGIKNLKSVIIGYLAIILKLPKLI